MSESGGLGNNTADGSVVERAVYFVCRALIEP